MRARRTAPWVAVSLTVAGVVFPFVLNALAGSHANAAKHAQTSCVSLTTARQGGHLVIWIRDEGVGGAIPSAELPCKS